MLISCQQRLRSTDLSSPRVETVTYLPLRVRRHRVIGRSPSRVALRFRHGPDVDVICNGVLAYFKLFPALVDAMDVVLLRQVDALTLRPAHH